MARSLRLVLPLVLALAATAVAQDRVAPVRTGFDPRLDGMPFENLGDYASPDGNCFGMALLAIDNFLRRQRARAEGRPDPEPPPITHDAQDGHLDAQVLASLVQAIASAKDDGDNSPLETADPDDPELMRAALERMRRTGVPELMGMYAADDSAHEVVVFGYERGRLLIYDPNYPGETVRWPWDPVRGFGRHPRRDDDDGTYGPLDEYDVGPFDGFRTARELQALRDACAQGLDACVGRFHPLRATLDGSVVTGTVGPGLTTGEDGITPERPHRVYLVVDGTPVTSARIQPDGSFRLTVPPGTNGTRYQVVAVTEEDGLLAGVNEVESAPRRPARSRGLAGALGGVGD